MTQAPDHHGRFTEQVDGWFCLKDTTDLLNTFPTSALSNEAGGRELLAPKETPNPKNPKSKELRNTNRAQTASDTITPQLIATPNQSVHSAAAPGI